MARTLKQIQDGMVAAHNADTDLAPLNNSSATARWRLIYFVVAASIHLYEVMMDALRLELEAIRDESIPGTVEWYRRKAFEWQNGHSLLMIDGRPSYAVDDPVARIIARSAVLETPTGGLLIKVAKDNGGVLQALTGGELGSITGFYREIHFAGTPVALLSQNADLLRISGQLWFDATMDPAALATAAEAAVAAYLGGLPFNGRIRQTEVMAAILAVDGITDAASLLVETNPGAGWIALTREAVPVSGWLILDASYPFLTAITWNADVRP